MKVTKANKVIKTEDMEMVYELKLLISEVFVTIVIIPDASMINDGNKKYNA
jgi:hypothetical protein